MNRKSVDITQKSCTVEEFFAEAESLVGSSAWVLFETAKKAGLVRLAACRKDELAGFSRVIVFSAHGECRMEKDFSAEKGRVRMVQVGTKPGKECFEREQDYLLRRDAGAVGRLVCREYFRPDESGMLRLYCECLAGVREEKQ